ncbi:hypothetical protein PybrP1_010507 [[Pythium] brassicae (nom. inval.)]|nr:hypothetical protein PybrP1_010507 [[Pythium] brassicae (nom. inval.)]
MKTAFLLASALASIAAVNAAVISHDAVKPFAQPAPTTSAHEAAIKFKPQIHISNGCHPYPAVDAAGNTSGGLKPSGGYSKHAPPKAGTVAGTSVKVDYKSKGVVNHALGSTSTAGEQQPLIMWDQLTPAARTALENTKFGSANVPMKDGNFMNKLGKAYPF